MKPLIQVKDLHVHYHSEHAIIHAVRGVDMHIDYGEIVGIVGESGCGKSALARSFLGLNQNADVEGSIIYDGKNLLELEEEAMREIRGKEISMVFQDPLNSLNPTMKIGKQLTEGLRQHFPKMSRQQRKNRALTILEACEIPDPVQRLGQFPHELSGGLRQRIIIATAMICHPHLLIADEPTTALDVSTQKQILKVMKGLNTTILFISHDLNTVSKFCDRVFVMYAGKFVEVAGSQELFKQPEHPYTQNLLKALPAIGEKKELIAIPGQPPHLSKKCSGCSFAPRCDQSMSQCIDEDPPLYEVHRMHLASCHLLDPRNQSEYND